MHTTSSPEGMIMKWILLILFSAVTLIGCSSTHRITDEIARSDENSLTISQFNALVDGKEITIVLLSGAEYRSHRVALDSDSVRFFELPFGDPRALPLRDVSRFRHGGEGVGIVGGAIGGEIAGFAIAAVVSLVSGKDRNLGLNSARALLIGAPLGALAGITVGATGRFENVYVIQPDPRASYHMIQKPNMP